MKIVFSVVFLVSLLSCSSDDGKPVGEPEFIGKWKLIEQLSDPGDGSGTFQTIESGRIIEFFNNGTVSINGELCFMSTEVGEVHSGSYKLNSDSGTDFQYDGEITPNDCIFRETKVFFDLPVDGSLILSYLCIEPCAQKFIKLD